MRYGSKVSALQPESGVECDAAIPIISERLSDRRASDGLNLAVLQLASEVIEQDRRLPLLAQNGHAVPSNECLLLRPKRTPGR
jgi:hypothetical protein